MSSLKLFEYCALYSMPRTNGETKRHGQTLVFSLVKGARRRKYYPTGPKIASRLARRACLRSSNFERLVGRLSESERCSVDAFI